MKIIYLTDIHDALRELRALLASTEADLYLLSGDLIYKAFYEEERIYNFVCLQEEFLQIIRQKKLNISTSELALDIIRFPKLYSNKYYTKEVLLEKAYSYRELFELAVKTMREKYILIAELIEKYSQAQTWLLPGNYDIDLRFTDLYEYNLHCEVKFKRALKFAGYGGAPVYTSGIPSNLAVKYHEKKLDGILYSESYDFFKTHQPDVLVLHQPVYGFFDRLPGMGNVGSQGLRNYVDEFNPSLVLSGHVHEDYGIAKFKDTVFINPSNYGGVDSISGWQSGGTYSEIYMNDKNVELVKFKLHILDPSRNTDIPYETHIELLEVENTKNGLKEISKIGNSLLNQINCPLHLDEVIRTNAYTTVTL